ncbi:MAG: hypothetical protein H6Q58_1444 [Firmicutes bacterium]|nr:hypothetical protein [Bacillota bacterium]
MYTWGMCREAELSPGVESVPWDEAAHKAAKAPRREGKPAAEKKREGTGMRLFISINIEGELAEMFHKKVEEIKKHSVRGRFPEPGNMHLTVVFIGQTENVEAVKQAMDQLSAKSFELKFKKIGKFSRGGRETYFVGLRRNSMLRSINWQLSESLRSAGFEIDKREYTPHLTLGRNVVFEMDFDLEEFSREIAEMKARMKVEKISLMRSERVEGKQKYTEIYHLDLYD